MLSEPRNDDETEPSHQLDKQSNSNKSVNINEDGAGGVVPKSNTMFISEHGFFITGLSKLRMRYEVTVNKEIRKTKTKPIPSYAQPIQRIVR